MTPLSFAFAENMGEDTALLINESVTNGFHAIQNLGPSLCVDEATPISSMPASVDICLYTSYESATCVSKKISCDFSRNSNELAGYRGSERLLGQISQAKENKIEVKMETFASTDQASSLNTHGLRPCSGIVMVNESSQKASLGHILVADPSKIATTLKGQTGIAAKDEGTNVFLLLSNFTELGPVDLNKFYYRRIICSTKQALPKANITALFSTKGNDDSDQINVTKSSDGIRVEFERVNAKASDNPVLKKTFQINSPKKPN